MRARLGKTFQSLYVRNYRLFLAGQMTKLLGVWMQFTAQDWLVLQLAHNSAYALGVVTALQFAPILLLTLYGGKLADRHDKRRIIIAANWLLSGLALGLGLLVATDRVTLHWVFLAAALMGVVNAIETPVRQAFVSELVGREILPNALSLSAAGFNVARVVGPAVAGVAIDVIALAPVFLLNTLTYLAPVLALSRMRTPELYREPMAATTDTSIREGLRYVRRRTDLLMPVLLVLAIGTVGFNFQLTLPVLAKTVFHTGAAQFGLLSTALAAGALGGAFAGSGRRSRPSLYVVLGAAIGFGTLETVAGMSSSFPLTAALLVPCGFFMLYFVQAANQSLQLGSDAAHRGRVMSLFIFVFMGTTPVAAAPIGWLSQQLGPRFAIWCGGLLSLIAGLVALAWQLRRDGARIRVSLKPLPRFQVVTPTEATIRANAIG